MDNKRKIFIKQFLSFNYIGLMTTALGFFIYIILLQLEFGYVIALIGDYLFGIIFSYFMNKKYTFKAKIESDFIGIGKTFITYLISFFLNLKLLDIFINIYLIDAIRAQVISSVFLAILNFFLFKIFIFSKKIKGIEC